MTPHRDQFPNCLDFIFHKRCVNFRRSAIGFRDWLGATLLDRSLIDLTRDMSFAKLTKDGKVELRITVSKLKLHGKIE